MFKALKLANACLKRYARSLHAVTNIKIKFNELSCHVFLKKAISLNY